MTVPPAPTRRGHSDTDGALSDDDRDRIAPVEERLDVHQQLIAELQAEGLISTEHAAHLEGAPETARTIGAAVGIIMMLRRVSEVRAFELSKKASMHGNRKRRLGAQDVVLTGDISQFRKRV